MATRLRLGPGYWPTWRALRLLASLWSGPAGRASLSNLNSESESGYWLRLLAASQAIDERELVTRATGQLPGLGASTGAGQRLDTTAGFYPTAEEPYPTAEEPYPHRVINRTA